MATPDPTATGYQPARPPATSKEEMDQALAVLSAHGQEWVNLPIEERIALVEQVQSDFSKVWERWVESAVAAKGIAERKTGNDREWLEIAPINRLHNVLLRSLRDIRDGQKPKITGGYR